MNEKPVVLIVDDEASVRTAVGCIVKASKVDVTILLAYHAEHAMSLIDGHNPAIVITDKDMPGMDGVELTRILKEKFPGVHIVLMSGTKPPKDHGADIFLEKPFDAMGFIREIRRVLNAQ